MKIIQISVLLFLFLWAISIPDVFGDARSAVPIKKASSLKIKNLGEDFTRPLARFDVRLKYTDKSDESHQLKNDYRLDCPFVFKNKWQIGLRSEVPMIANDTRGSDNREGHWGLGLGDVLTQAALISPEHTRFRYGGGLRVVWPSASERQMGSEKYQLGPTAGMSYSPRFLPEGSFCQFIWREQFSAGGDKGRADIHNTVLSPALHLTLPHDCYVSYSPDITISWIDTAKWSVPFNLSFGKKIRRVIFSVEWNQALVKEHKEYDWNLETRVGYFF